MSNLRRAARASVGVIAGLTAVALPAATAGAVPSGCAPGFDDPGLVTLAEGLALPRLVAGVAAGTYTVAELTAVFEFIDANDDGRICVKAVSNLRGQSVKHWGHFYLGADNRHPVH